jgi:hypothetical protein
LSQSVKLLGLKVDLEKCVVMKRRWKTVGMEKTNCNNHEIKEVESCKYLGSQIMTNRSVENKITERIKNSGKFYQLIRDILWK